MKLSPLFLSLILPFSAYSDVSNEQEQKPKIAQQIKSFMNAQPINRTPPEYPRNMARGNTEGWVQLSFVVDTEGKPKNVTVINSSGKRAFERAAQRAVKTWEYEPAIENGEKVEQCNTTVQLDFRLGSLKGAVRSRYRRLLLDGFDAIDEADQEKLDLTLEKLEKMKIQVLAEHSWLEFLKANAAKLKNEPEQQLHHLKRAVPSHYQPSKDTILPEAYVVTVLQEMFILQYNSGLYGDAMNTFNKLDKMESDGALTVANHFRPHYEKLDNIIKSKEVMDVKGQISEFSNWSHNLMRSKFVISNVEGNLDKVDIRCRSKQFVYTFEENNQFQIPESFGKCQLILEGKQGSQFTLSELL